MPERLSDAEIEAYRKRVTGVTPFPGGAVPRGAEAAKAALDNWHLRNLATIDGLRADSEDLRQKLAEAQQRERVLREAMLDTLGNLHVIDATAGTGVFGDDPADRFAKIRAKRLEAHNRIVDAMNIPAPRACDAATPPP